MALAEDLGVFPSTQAGLKGPAGADLDSRSSHFPPSQELVLQAIPPEAVLGLKVLSALSQLSTN